MYITTCIYITLHIYHITTCIYYRIVELDSTLNKNNNCKIYNTEYSKSNVIIVLSVHYINPEISHQLNKCESGRNLVWHK